MQKEILDLTVAAYRQRIPEQDTFEDELIISSISQITDFGALEFIPIRLDACSIFLVLEGTMNIELSRHSYQLTSDMVLEMETGDVIENIDLSTYFKGYHILIARRFKIEITAPVASYFPADTIKLKRLHPVRELDNDERESLLDIIRQLQRYITTRDHLFREQMIKAGLNMLLFEMHHQLCNHYVHNSEEMLDGETIPHRFRELLVKYCKEEHEVSFYAARLCVTSDYLSRVIREVDGISALKCIHQVLLTEAKILLRKPDTNIKLVADLLHFSDQSAFGKFFKLQTGMSPLQYKKQR